MDNINKTIKDIRPSLHSMAPQTFWFSIGFGIFNILVGFSLYNVSILINLHLLGIIPIKVWALVFLIHGGAMLGSLLYNNWRVTRSLHLVGVAIKTAWWMELVAVTIIGRSPFVLYVWSLILFLQFVIWIYFTPRVGRVK